MNFTREIVGSWELVCTFAQPKYHFKIMSTVIAHIDVSRPLGRKIVRDLHKHKRTVKMENPLPQDYIDGNYYTLDEVIARGKARLIAHYGEEMRLLFENEK